MSSIPNAKMKHAHVHHDAPEEPKQQATIAPDLKAETLGERARELAGEAVEVVKERPKTVAAIGAAVLAGAAALIGGPAIAKAIKGDTKPASKKAAPKKTPAKTAAAKKTPATKNA